MIPFAKYSACGNDFILIDNRKFCHTPSIQTVSHLCHRQLGIGADGLILLENPLTSQEGYRMRIFNQDGSEAEMCGNGLRSLANFIRLLDPATAFLPSFKIETMERSLDVCFDRDLVSVTMPKPAAPFLIKLAVEKKTLSFYSLNTGVPHAVLFVDDLENEEIFCLAPFVRQHEAFQPNGTNVNFAKIISKDLIAMRTYERGVEKETLACGTGACAVAMVAAANGWVENPTQILTRSGEYLQMTFTGFQGEQCHLEHASYLKMKGAATQTFEGIFDANNFHWAAF